MHGIFSLKLASNIAGTSLLAGIISVLSFEAVYTTDCYDLVVKYINFPEIM